MALFGFNKKTAQPNVKTEVNVPKNVVIFEYIKKLEGGIGNHSALYLYTNKLQNQNLSSLPRQALIETFSTIVKKNGGELFALPNDNTLVVYNKKSFDEIQSALVKISFLFHGDPIVDGVADINNSKFLKVFDLASDVEKLKQIVMAAMNDDPVKDEQGVGVKQKKNIKPIAEPVVEAKKLLRNLSPEILAKLEEILDRTDFTGLIRRQSVCAVIGKSSPQPLFDEVFISISDLRDTLLPDVDFTANPWLFKAFTEVLDKGVLTNLARREDSFLANNFSLNLNVDTILSDTFLAFDNSISPQMRGTVVLELQIMDILSDVRAYNLAKVFARSRGYKICIDGITTDGLNYINKSFLDADYIKIIWSQDLKDAIESDKSFSDYDNKTERSKMIICRVDDEKAIEIGNSIGINLYQGHYVQRLASQAKKTIYEI